MTTRNFYIHTDIDGRQSPLAGGPQGKDGGFTTVITYRDHGTISDARLEIIGRAMPDGTLFIDVFHGEEFLTTIASQR